ncbi:mannose-1-phosphate guanylyltransferase/mannose-6-phosphate isomerase [Acinetobacter sp. GSS19]|uniref:mannose-1-phosphate guanylyltransferase/mannose-6-phosphate isomerase n=1 Tax=Acinetobacter sp. GSS19 TaxID=3020716 RepID=UPI002360899E|nr:mannose-1-phosphate guanylyltransferase/mannose-6-phosphate isomerase [Acinetobacter sp. GSS19]
MKLIPTILCGGAGSRLWPVSREQHPKPFIRLADNESLLQKAFLRGVGLPGVSEILTVTNSSLKFKTEDDYKEVNNLGVMTHFILEPFARNTAAATAAAALYAIERYSEDTLLLILAADHLISKPAAFEDAVNKAINLAKQNKLVTFGITPDKPETGYGYIEANGYEVKKFVEKPSLEVAKEYIASGRFYWNSGIFCFKAGVLVQEMMKYCPEIIQMVSECLRVSNYSQVAGVEYTDLDRKAFENVPDLSIDYAVMEHSNNVAVVPCDIGWDDVGSWSSIGALGELDEAGNTVIGEAVLHNVHNTYIHSDSNKLVGAVGVDNLVIVDTPDALLVADKSCVQDVKIIFNSLKKKDHDAFKLHRSVVRPWGTYTVLEEGERFKIKRIVVKPGASLSLQMHHHRSEHWIVVQGAAQIVNGEKEVFVSTNESTYIPAGHKHRLINPGVIDLVLIEVQSGEYLGEDDIVRFEDVYGRC